MLKPSPDNSTYVGEELDLFAQARNWKAYWARMIEPYVGRRVLEVGAGTGTNTVLLASNRQETWICLEPDRNLAAELELAQKRLSSSPRSISAMVGNLQSIPAEARFDTILYIDVLEHIEADAAETTRAFQLLEPGGHLIVLSPAHQFLFSPFDQGLGHFRRYSRGSLRAVGPAGRQPKRLFYLDAAGFFASMANRLLLKQKLPTENQIKFWDTRLIPLSRVADPLLGFGFGKTVVGIWEKA